MIGCPQVSITFPHCGLAGRVQDLNSPHQGQNPCPLYWELKVLDTEQPGKSLGFHFLTQRHLYTSVLFIQAFQGIRATSVQQPPYLIDLKIHRSGINLLMLKDPVQIIYSIIGHMLLQGRLLVKIFVSQSLQEPAEAYLKLQTFPQETRTLNMSKIKIVQCIFVMPQRGQHCALHIVGVKCLKICYLPFMMY